MSRASIVLVHGWGFDSSVWATLQTHLKKFNTITIDLPGYGEQKNNKTEWKLDQLTDDLIARTPKNAIWLGWSLGGLLTLYIAAQKPTHIKALLTIASTPSFTQKPGWNCAMDIGIFNTFKQSCKNDKDKCLQDFRGLVSLGAEKKTIMKTRAQTCTADIATLLAGLALLEQTDLRLTLKKIKCPRKYLFASKDSLVPTNACTQINHYSDSNEIVLINDASHALPLSHPKIITQHTQALIHATH
ncbi:alpha/beta fold hydrolase [Beggiatoa alba]|nr:alpha/beta fold hydrolase [Beggiatoa alba]